MALLMRDIHSTPIRTVAPTLLPVLIQQVKDELRVSDDSRNTYLYDLVKRATAQVEIDARLAIMTQTWQLYLDEFPCREIELRKGPVASLTHLKYTTGGVLTTLSSSLYETDFVSAPARVQPLSTGTWPTADCKANAIQLEWIAGYASTAAVPQEIKDTVLYAVTQKYRGCELGSYYWDHISRIKKFGFLA